VRWGIAVLDSVLCARQREGLTLLRMLARMFAALIFLAPVSAWADPLTAKEAAKHVGESATVCGKVVSADYAQRTKGAPTFLNLDAAYPHQAFTILIWGSDREKFGAPETALMGKPICVTGTIRLFHDVPEMVVTDPGALKAE
jgi:hypothetical protein